jgi:hypothetical protein
MLGVTWDAVTGATSYEVYYGETGTPDDTPNQTVTETFADITALTNTTTYNVWVKAKNNIGASEYSDMASGTPEAATIPAGLNQYFQSQPYMDMAAYAYYDDSFAVDSGAKTFYQYGDSTFETKWGGPIVKIVSDGEAYIMIVKITEVTGSWFVPPEIGKYFAAAYKNLSTFAVTQSAAAKFPDGKNAGVDTLAEAVSEYTVANEYYGSFNSLYFPHNTSAVTLASLQGNWVSENDPDYLVQIRGTKLTEWYDDGGDGVYDALNDDETLAELGDIVDHTDTSQAEGVLYVKIIASDMMFSAEKFMAIAWKGRTPSSISFATSTSDYESLDIIKAALNDATNGSQFPSGSFNDYTK